MSTERPRVLLVDDEKDVRDMLAALFERWEYQFTMMTTATEGLRTLMERKFDIVVLDNWLPDLEGIELCRQIREFDKRTPIIFFSGSDMGGEERLAIEAGANAYLLKGEGLGNLRETMAQQLARANHKRNP